MDLLSGLRKGDTSRGGRAEFSWDAVKEDKDRENYLGHSLMAPVGRWQRNKDLTWYSKAGAGTAEEQRREEIRLIKEAEQDALSEALGFPVQPRNRDVMDQGELARAIKEARGDDDGAEERGVGFGRRGAPLLEEGGAVEASGGMVDDGFKPAVRDEKRSGRREEDGKRGGRRDEKERSRRHRSRSPSRERRHRHRSGSRRRDHRHRDDKPRHRDDKDGDRLRHRDGDRPRHRDDKDGDRPRHRDDRDGDRPRHRDDKDGDRNTRRRHDERRRSRSRSVRRDRDGDSRRR